MLLFFVNDPAHTGSYTLSYTTLFRSVALRFVDNFGKVTQTYPANPNGSANGITAVTSESGRATIMMPHPERVFRTVSNSWHPENWGEDSPWMRIFRNARKQLG